MHQQNLQESQTKSSFAKHWGDSSFWATQDSWQPVGESTVLSHILHTSWPWRIREERLLSTKLCQS